MSFEKMNETIRVLREKASENEVIFPIVIGCAMINEQSCSYIGADYLERDAMSGVRLCQKRMEE